MIQSDRCLPTVVLVWYIGLTHLFPVCIPFFVWKDQGETNSQVFYCIQ